MPNRILHESIKYCPKMEQLNWFEEVVYHRLTVSVDDYGCLDGRIVLLKNTLFPTREDISKDDIARAIEHMVALGLLRAYEAGGMPYLHFPAWEEEQRVRNKRRKFPAPPDEEEPLAAEDSLSAADGGEFFAEEKHLTASCCQLTAGCPPESNPYPNPYPNPDSNPKFESGSVTNPYPIQAPGACAEERPRAGEQSLRHSLRCDTVPQFSMGASLRSQSSLERLPASLGLLRPASATGGGLRAPLYSREAIDGAIPEDGVRPLAGESPRPASALPSEGAREAPREDGQSLRHSLRCDTVPQFSMGASLRSQSSLERLPASLGLLRPASATGGGLRAPLCTREAIDGAIPEDGVRPLAGESPRPASALPSEGAQEAPREDGQSLRHSLRCDTVPQFSMGASLRSQSSLEMLPASLGLLRPASATGGGLRAPLFAKREAIDGAIPEDGVRPLAGESPRPASALPSEGAQEAPREEGQSLHRGCAAPKRLPLASRGAVSEAD